MGLTPLVPRALVLGFKSPPKLALLPRHELCLTRGNGSTCEGEEGVDMDEGRDTTDQGSSGHRNTRHNRHQGPSVRETAPGVGVAGVRLNEE